MTSDHVDCPFCRRILGAQIAYRQGTAAAFPDGFPVSEGHTLVVPVRHEADFFRLSRTEQSDVLSLADVVRAELQAGLSPDGFNIGINAGAAAGQTVGHAHVHVIPRYAGDVPDPRGGMRWVVPGRAAYWPEGPAGEPR